MQFSLNLDLSSIQEWGLNIKEGAVFAFIYACPSWCVRDENDPDFFNLSNGKLATELPSVSDKRDTMSRHVSALVDAGLIEKKTVDKKQFLKLTNKGKMWNQDRSKIRDKNPVAERCGKKIPDMRDKNPVDAGNSSDVSVIPISGIPTSDIQSREERAKREVAEAYRKHITWGQGIYKWTKSRASQLRQLLKNHPETREPGFWDAYFCEASRDKFIRGEIAPRPGQDPFKVSIDYLLRESVYVGFYEKVMDGVKS